MIPVKYTFDTILISDVHLGSKLCQAVQLYNFLRQSKIKKLILIGDIFDNINMKRLSKFHFKVLKEIRHISKHTEVIWVRGNHDEIPSNLMSLILGVDVYNSYKWIHIINEDNMIKQHQMFAVHGDIWDVFIYKYKFITKLVTEIFNIIQKINFQWMFSITKKLKYWSKEFSRNIIAVRESALEYAKNNDVKAIFCGHTHYAELVDRNGIIYGNDGTWQTDDPTFIHVSNNKIELYKYTITSIQLKDQKFIN